MDKDINVWFYDILQSIKEIESFFENKPKLFDEFVKDIRTKRAVERELEIIGEAVSRILKKDSTITITNARKIVDTRNRIIHGYDTLTDDFIWSIIINHLPSLKNEVERMLK
jgi:uncharacterized protein with HEPN domain